MAWDTPEGQAALEAALAHGYNVSGIMPQLLANQAAPMSQPVSAAQPQYTSGPTTWSNQPTQIGSQFQFNTPQGTVYSSVPRLPWLPGPSTAATGGPVPQPMSGNPRITPPHVGEAGMAEGSPPVTQADIAAGAYGPPSPVLPLNLPDVVHGGTVTLSPDQITAIRSVFPQSEWGTAQLIAAAESKGNNGAIGSAGEVGLFQIHPVNWLSLSQALGIPINAQTLQDPMVNARAAFVLWQGSQGWGRKSGNPWTTAPAVFNYLGGA